jgi:hypothetical protein
MLSAPESTVIIRYNFGGVKPENSQNSGVFAPGGENLKVVILPHISR